MCNECIHIRYTKVHISNKYGIELNFKEFEEFIQK